MLWLLRVDSQYMGEIVLDFRPKYYEYYRNVKKT